MSGPPPKKLELGVITLTGAHFDAAAAWSRNFYASKAIVVPRVHRDVAQPVLGLHLLADAARRGDELTPVASLVHVSAGLLGEAAEGVFPAEGRAMDPDEHLALGIVHRGD